MRMKKNIALLIFGVMLVGSISTAFGYHEYIYRWETHIGCHGGQTESENGTMTLTLNFTGTIETGKIFNVTATMLNFTEPLNDSTYDGRFTIGLPGNMTDNALFSSSLEDNVIKRRESVDENGTYENPEDRYGNPSYSNVFMLLAPAEPGTYTLTITAMCGMNQSDESAKPVFYVNGEVSITVVSSVDDVDPMITTPSDLAVDNDYTGETIAWTATDTNPDTYTITRNGIAVVTATAWTSAEEVEYAIPDGLEGVNVYTIEFTDDSGNSARDTVVVTVAAAAAEEPDPDPTPIIPGFQALYIIVPIAIVAMAVLLKRKVKI